MEVEAERSLLEANELGEIQPLFLQSFVLPLSPSSCRPSLHYFGLMSVEKNMKSFKTPNPAYVLEVWRLSEVEKSLCFSKGST